MSKLTELFRLHDLAVVKQRNLGARSAWGPKRALLIKTYGDAITCEEIGTYAWIKCDACSGSHHLYSEDNSFNYGWPGQGYLASKTPLPLDTLHELIKTKKEELEAARKKRFERIKSPRDAVRLIFRDLGVNVQMVSGHPRFDCGPFELEFKASKDDSDPQVHVSFIYREYYVKETLLTKLSIADPDFSNKIEAILYNGKNLNKLMLGEVQPKLVN